MATFEGMMSIRRELRIVWALLTAATMVLFVLTAILEDDLVLRYTPTCYSVKYRGVECAFCGMSRAFLRISEFRFQEAASFNRGSLFVAGMMLLNILAFMGHGLYTAYSTKKH